MNRIVFLSFATKNFEPALVRIGNEAAKLNVFSDILLYNEDNLSSQFKSTHKNILNYNIRGYGYWIWKPYIINKTLQSLDEHDFLFYFDAGCEINPNAHRKFNYFLSKLKKSKGILASRLINSNNKEFHATKGEIFEHFNVSDNTIVTTPQIEATIVFIQKNDFSVKFIKDWHDTCNNFPFLLDFSTKFNDLPFLNNKGDQSIFSVLGKIYKIDTIPYYELYLNRYVNKIIKTYNGEKIKIRRDEFKLFLLSRYKEKTIQDYLKTNSVYPIIRNFALKIYNIFYLKIYGYKVPRFRS